MGEVHNRGVVLMGLGLLFDDVGIMEDSWEKPE